MAVTVSGVVLSLMGIQERLFGPGAGRLLQTHPCCPARVDRNISFNLVVHIDLLGSWEARCRIQEPWSVAQALLG